MITRKDVNFELKKASNLLQGKVYDKEKRTEVDIELTPLLVAKGVLKIVTVAVKILLSIRTNQLRIMDKLEVPLLKKEDAPKEQTEEKK